MLEIARLVLDTVATNPQLAVLVTALAGLAVAALAIFALMQAIRVLGKRK